MNLMETRRMCPHCRAFITTRDHICPYCGEGKVRAPDAAVGLSATCPRCYSAFTIMASEKLAKERAAGSCGRRRRYSCCSSCDG